MLLRPVPRVWHCLWNSWWEENQFNGTLFGMISLWSVPCVLPPYIFLPSSVRTVRDSSNCCGNNWRNQIPYNENLLLNYTTFLQNRSRIMSVRWVKKIDYQIVAVECRLTNNKPCIRDTGHGSCVYSSNKHLLPARQSLDANKISFLGIFLKI